MQNLFEHAAEKRLREEQPLAARMRPRTLDEFVGQDHILAPGRLLRRAIQADSLSSLIFYGPPGTGKTTLASVIANTTRSHFVVLNAVLAGVSELREVTAGAHRRLTEHNRRTILFVDEVHRWNKAQQDALLPWVENGTIMLIGATTENPYFTVNRALVSRSRVFQLKQLDENDLRRIADQALADPLRGYGGRRVEIAREALDHLVGVANGDARALLNALELAVETTPPAADSTVRIGLEVAEDSIQRRAVLYDHDGDCHFDTISAFIKSLRGSDPDAALYWLAKMVYAGEDPRFIFRRLLIFCGEDIGLADPQALAVTEAAAAAFDRVGLPEGRYHLGMATLYLATAPKSNSVMGFFDALAAVEKEQEGEVPNHLKDASRDSKGFGHGQGYQYPHAYRDHWVAQQYLPDSLLGKIFYQPGRLGHEAALAATVQRRREEQLAAWQDAGGGSGAPPEILSNSPPERGFEKWLARTINAAGGWLGSRRDAMFAAAACPRHAVVLVLNAADGLLLWEAVRRTPEGGVWALVKDEAAAGKLREQARQCPELRQPEILVAPPAGLPGDLTEQERFALPGFDLLLGRQTVAAAADRQAFWHSLAALRRPAGAVVLAETLPCRGQRLYRLVDAARQLGPELAARLAAAEDAIYTDPADPLVNWDAPELEAWAHAAGFQQVELQLETQTRQQPLADTLVAGWFADSANPAAAGRPTYAARLAAALNPEEIARIRDLYIRELAGRTVPWTTVTATLKAC